MQIDFEFSIGDTARYFVGNKSVAGVIIGLYQYKTEPTQALLEYIGTDGVVSTIWRNEHELEH